VGVDVVRSSRMGNVVTGKKVLSLILRQLGFEFKDIGRVYGYDHSTIMYHVSTMTNLIERYDEYRDFYNSVKSEFENSDIDVPLHYSYVKLPIKLANYIDSVKLDNAMLRKEIEELRRSRNDRMNDLFNIIESNTPVGMEQVVLRKIKKLFNV
jgi:hypothetical protein